MLSGFVLFGVYKLQLILVLYCLVEQCDDFGWVEDQLVVKIGVVLLEMNCLDLEYIFIDLVKVNVLKFTLINALWSLIFLPNELKLVDKLSGLL